ncbi:MAG: hypothetical protein ORN23_00535 [Chthoniobacterales bacterium]|nr:hypothetical protein [Chthoniobacterales bacterium]
MMNIFKPSEPKVTEVKSPEPNLDRNYFDELKLLKQKAIEQLIDRKKRITCDIQNQIEELQVKLKAELADIHAKLKELGHITETTTSSPKQRGARKFHPAVTDEVLKQKFSTLLSDGKKAGSKEIFAALDISRPRFIAFQKNCTGYLVITGSKKTTQYSLKA